MPGAITGKITTEYNVADKEPDVDPQASEIETDRQETPQV